MGSDPGQESTSASIASQTISVHTLITPTLLKKTPRLLVIIAFSGVLPLLSGLFGRYWLRFKVAAVPYCNCI